MKWDDNDPLPRDINVAHLRAKYYGARYIIHRPLLYHALHPMAPSGAAASPLSLKELDPKDLAACMTCVEAAMNSTTAFDGVQGRPIITNIFGTAHA